MSDGAGIVATTVVTIAGTDATTAAERGSRTAPRQWPARRQRALSDRSDELTSCRNTPASNKTAAARCPLVRFVTDASRTGPRHLQVRDLEDLEQRVAKLVVLVLVGELAAASPKGP